MHHGIPSERGLDIEAAQLPCWMLCSHCSLPPKLAFPPGGCRFPISELEPQAATWSSVEQQESLPPQRVALGMAGKVKPPVFSWLLRQALCPHVYSGYPAPGLRPALIITQESPASLASLCIFISGLYPS